MLNRRKAFISASFYLNGLRSWSSPDALSLCSELLRLPLSILGMTGEGWLPKPQVELHQALIPVWLARKFGYTISTDSFLYD